MGSNLNIEDEIRKLEEELAYTRGFLDAVDSKLGNNNFVQNAPSRVVDGERKKQSDALSRIRVLEDQLSAYKKQAGLLS